MENRELFKQRNEIEDKIEELIKGQSYNQGIGILNSVLKKLEFQQKSISDRLIIS